MLIDTFSATPFLGQNMDIENLIMHAQINSASAVAMALWGALVAYVPGLKVSSQQPAEMEGQAQQDQLLHHMHLLIEQLRAESVELGSAHRNMVSSCLLLLCHYWRSHLTGELHARGDYEERIRG